MSTPANHSIGGSYPSRGKPPVTLVLWVPRQCSITGDDGKRWRGTQHRRAVTPTEAASRRAWGRTEEPHQYLYETKSSSAFSKYRRTRDQRDQAARRTKPLQAVLADRATTRAPLSSLPVLFP